MDRTMSRQTRTRAQVMGKRVTHGEGNFKGGGKGLGEKKNLLEKITAKACVEPLLLYQAQYYVHSHSALTVTS